ncbi:MAG TPA: hypothetical protein VFE46_02725 [Pirellulales bacterium]|nr:hypothetical protein [Pirellulales bacterium]
MEADRRDIADQRVRDPLVANALEAVGLVLACLAPLVICAYALKQAGSVPAEEELGTILVQELTSERPQLLPTLDGAPSSEAGRWNSPPDPALLKHSEPTHDQ